MTRFELATFRSTGDCSKPTELHPQVLWLFNFQGSVCLIPRFCITCSIQLHLYYYNVLQVCQGILQTFF